MRLKSLTWLMYLDDCVPNETQGRFRVSHGGDPAGPREGQMAPERSQSDPKEARGPQRGSRGVPKGPNGPQPAPDSKSGALA